MQLTTLQHCLVRLNDNLIYYFFLNNDNSLNYNIYTGDNILIRSEKLASYIIEFSVTADINQRIHLVCITRAGELHYYINQNDNWSYKTISRLDTRSNIYKYLSLHICDSYTHIICTKTNILTKALSTIEHIYWSQKKVNRIIVSSYVHGKYTSPLQIFIDRLKNIHVVYKVYYKNNHQLYYCRFNILSKTWTMGELMTNLQEDHSHPYIFIDTKNNLHLVWCTIEDNNFILKYKKRSGIIDSKSKWSDVQTLSNKNSNNLSPILMQQSDTLKIYCKQSNKITEFISNDFGSSWTDSANSKSYFVDGSKIIQYSDASQDNLYLARHVYGNIANTIELIGISLFNKEENQPLSVQPIVNSEESTLIDISKKADTQPILTKDIIDLIKDIDEKIDNILLQIIEQESKNGLMYVLTKEISHVSHKIKQGDNGAENSELLDNVADETEESNTLINELLSNYNFLEKQLIKIEEEKQNLVDLTSDYKFNIKLLEEEIASFKKQMLSLQERLNKLTSNSSMFQRFINLFK